MHNARPVFLDMTNIDFHMHALNVQMINNTNVYLCVQRLVCGYKEQFLAFHHNMASCN